MSQDEAAGVGERRFPGYPRRPLLRPGVRVCRRADGQLQVGLDARVALVAADRPEVRAVLTGLREGTPPQHPSTLPRTAARFCADLLIRGLVVDGDDLLGAVGRAEGRRAKEVVAATFADLGQESGAVLRRRSQLAVEVGHTEAPAAARRCRTLLGDLGVPVADPGTGRDPVLHVARTEPDRALTDAWMRADRPHLPVGLADGELRVGPLVVPGRTACVRCVDAHLTETDARRSLVLHQYVDEAAPRLGVPDPIPHDLLDLALVWAVRDLVRFLDGHRPRCWSATLRVDPALELAVTRWPVHPACGCGWGLAAG